MKRITWALWWLLVAGCADDSATLRPDGATMLVDAAPLPDAGPPSGDILADLRAVPGMMNVVEAGTPPPGYRAFTMEYEQPVDHLGPASGTLRQRLRLLHRAYDAPMVLSTLGYDIGSNNREVITTALGSNQLLVEHRFFGTSRPSPVDWSKLDIRQAANDHHRVTVALKWIYPRRWINFGASKGGMTAVYHRRFFPDDVEGTVAYVAPLSLSHDDPRYIPFIDAVGPDPSCREALREFQRIVLSHRADMLGRMTGSFDHLGKEVALEHGVLELPFFFWQYRGVSGCANIPTDSATSSVLFAFLDRVAALRSNYGDEDLARYAAYYVQAEHELGYPALAEAHVAKLLLHPGTTGAALYVPTGVQVSYVPAAMADIDRWVRESGQRLLFVYGEYDPWTAGAFELGPSPRDSFKLIVRGGNHGSDIADLDDANRALALDALSRWADAPIVDGLTKPRAEPRRRERSQHRLQ